MNKQEFIIAAIQNRLFTFADVIASKHEDSAPYYADMRSIYSYPELLRFAVDWCEEVLATKQYDFFCGIETASLPLVGALSLSMSAPSLYLRTKPKGYGLSKLVEGHYQSGDEVYLIDDLSIEAFESLEFIEIAEKAELRVKGLIVLYEKARSDKGRDLFIEKGYEYESLFSYVDLANTIQKHYRTLCIDESMAELVLNYGNNI